MPSVKAANLGHKLRRLPVFGAQIGMTLDTELVSYSGQGLVVASMLPVAGDTVRGEPFARLMHQTSVTCRACSRCGHAEGISVALLTFIANEVVGRSHITGGKDSRSMPDFCPQRYLTQQQQNDPPAYDKPESPPRQNASS